MQGGFHPVISLASNTEHMLWAADDSDTGTPGRYWGVSAAGAMLLAGHAARPKQPRSVTITELRQGISSAVELELRSELDGQVSEFGARFWELLCERSEPVRTAITGSDTLIKATYSDRYVRNPVSCAILGSVLHELCSRATTDSGTRVCVYGQTFDRTGKVAHLPSKVWHDWIKSEDRDTALASALEFCGINAVVKSHASRPHGRYCELEFSSGRSIRIRLDQGFSFWEVPESATRARRHFFDFRLDAYQQGKVIAKLSIDVSAPNDADTQIFVKT